jgi:predicted dehydrogenase
LCDSNFAAAQRLAVNAQPGLELFADHKFMAEALALDAVILCTPPATHPAIAIDLLQSGIHVLCEKPLAISTAAASEMFAVATRHDRVLTMASKFRFAADLVAARALIENGHIGDPVYFHLSFCSPVSMTGRWNADPLLSGGGVLMDNGPHAADIVRFLLGPVTAVQARRGRQVQSLAVEDNTQLMLETAGGAAGNVQLSWSCAAATDIFLHVSGTLGTIAAGWQASCWRRDDEREWRVFGNGYDKPQAFTAQLEHFAACVRGTAAPQVCPEAALASVEVVAAAYQSAGQGSLRPVGQLASLAAA